MHQHLLAIIVIQHRCLLTRYFVYDVWRGRHKPLIGKHVTEILDAQTQPLLIVLSETDVMWYRWHIVSVENMHVNGYPVISGDCHSHEQKLY